jgi:hypothetical protein
MEVMMPAKSPVSSDGTEEFINDRLSPVPDNMGRLRWMELSFRLTEIRSLDLVGLQDRVGERVRMVGVDLRGRLNAVQ